MKNIQFNYLYRDNSNYKNYGSIVLYNPNNLSIDILSSIILKNLINEEYFIANEWGIEELFFKTQNEDDHGFHEFLNLEYTDNNNCNVSIEEFVSRIQKT